MTDWVVSVMTRCLPRLHDVTWFNLHLVPGCRHYNHRRMQSNNSAIYCVACVDKLFTFNTGIRHCRSIEPNQVELNRNEDIEFICRQWNHWVKPMCVLSRGRGVSFARRCQSGKDVGSYLTSRALKTWRFLKEVITVCVWIVYGRMWWPYSYWWLTGMPLFSDTADF